MSRPKAFGIAATLLLMLSSGSVSARVARLETNLNLREAPAAQARVIAVMPNGANVMIGACDAEWCQVNFGGRRGFASKMHLGDAGGAYAAAPQAQAAPVKATEYSEDDGIRVWQWDDREWRDRQWQKLELQRPRR